MVNNNKKYAQMIKQSNSIIALTGAGISTAAGIPDFRGPQGLYVTRRYDPDIVFDITYFVDDPLPFFEFSRDFISETTKVKPTFTHEFLANLEKDGRLRAVITQNIDPLHEIAGSKNIIPLHGNYWDSYCLKCGKHYDYQTMLKKIKDEPIPQCVCGGVVKPDVVFFGEAVKGMDRASRLIAESDLLLVLGSSLSVHPAAILPMIAGGEILVINKGTVALDPAPHRHFINEDLDKFFKEIAKQIDL